jgi:hypothetical protein
MAFWPAEVEWHERDVVAAFRQWLETQGWETETEIEFVDVVARRGDEIIFAEVKGRTKSRPGAGLDTLYGQLLRRMPVEEVGDSDTRFAVVIPTGAETAALRVPRRVRDLLRIDIYVVSDDGQVEKLFDSEALQTKKRGGETVAPSRPMKAVEEDWKSWPNPQKLERLLSKRTITDRSPLAWRSSSESSKSDDRSRATNNERLLVRSSQPGRREALAREGRCRCSSETQAGN